MLSKTRAFTLVELLVVIGIISLLIAILLPALNKARAAANAIACASNMRQIGIGMRLYASENRDTIPLAYWRNLGRSQTWAYTDYIAQAMGMRLNQADLDTSSSIIASAAYGARGRLFLCPNDSPGATLSYQMPIGANASDGQRNATLGAIGIYIDNDNPANVNKLAVPWRFASVRNSTQCLLLVEKQGGALGGTGTTLRRARDQMRNLTATGYDIGTISLHYRTFNYLFVDGHVARLAPEETVNQVTPKLRTDPLLNVESLGAWTVTPDD